VGAAVLTTISNRGRDICPSS